MFRIRLLILLLISFIFFSCSKNNSNQNSVKYSLGYIGGEYDGLILKNLMMNNLSSFGLFDESSSLKIQPTISHSSELFITNIDNTSDRMSVKSELIVRVVDQKFNCLTNKFKSEVSQFYVFADSDKYISNNRAERKIRDENTEALIKRFINQLIKSKGTCKLTYE